MPEVLEMRFNTVRQQRRSIVTGALVLVMLVAPTVAQSAAEPSVVCRVAKLKATASHAKRVSKCLSKVIKKNLTLSSLILDDHVGICGDTYWPKLEKAWAKAEQKAQKKGDAKCETGATSTETAAEVEQALADPAKISFAALPGTGSTTPDKVERKLLRALLKAVTKFQVKILVAEAKELKRPDAEKLASRLAKDRLKFEKSWTKADSAALKKGLDFPLPPPSDGISNGIQNIVALVYGSNAGQGLALIVSSQANEGVTSAMANLAIDGKVLALVPGAAFSVVEWRIENGSVQTGQFAINPSGDWAGTVPLEEGDNTVTLGLPEAASAARSFIATYNPGYGFGGQLELTPDVAYVGAPRTITATIALTDADTNPAQVELVSLNNGIETTVATFTDDGDLGNGDEIAGDLVYSAFASAFESAEGQVVYRSVVARLSGGQARSERSALLITTAISNAELTSFLVKQQGMQVRLEAAASGGTFDAEVAAVAAELNADPTIADAGVTQSGRGAWFITESGIGGVLYEPGSDVKGGGGSLDGEAPAPYSSFLTAPSRSAIRARSAVALGAADNDVESNKAYVLAAQYFDWGENDDIPMMKTILETKSCFEVTYKRYLSKGSGSVEDFKGLGGYGVILISSHGDSFYNGLLSFWNDRFGWNGPFGQVILHSNMAVTPANKVLYQDDLKSGRLVIWYGHYGITPSFIRRYAGQLPNSLVYMSICRGTWNSTLAQAFLDRGAGSFLGYDDYVSVKFTQETGPPMLTTLLESGKTLADAFVSGQVDPYGSDNAEFKRFGATDLALGDQQGLLDGSFEGANLSQAWSVEGDGRKIPALGAASPTDGISMAVISTGLGFTSLSGELSQAVCLPPGADEISFDWNFFSEEWLEYVGSQFQDSFVVRLTDTADASNTAVLASHTIDSLAGSVSPVAISFDRGDVYATGWNSSTVSIPPSLRGKRVYLDFFATDVGDSIYDSAICIDDVKIEEP